MTTIIKAGIYHVETEKSQVVFSASGKALICLTNISTKKHLTCYTQTWVVKSAFGQQMFGEFQLASAYYSRLPDPKVG